MREDLRGKIFGAWKVLRRPVQIRNKKNSYFYCICSCGIKRWVWAADLKRGHSKGCKECGKKKLYRPKAVRRDPLYLCYQSMKQRCYCKKHSSYKWYGAKGVRVAKEWLGKKGFKNFRAAMGRLVPPGKTLDRKDSTKAYSSKNCRWATIKEQNVNKQKSLWVRYQRQHVPLISIFPWGSPSYKRIAYRRRKYKWGTQKAFDFVRNNPVKEKI